jgi:hypothetical protein
VEGAAMFLFEVFLKAKTASRGREKFPSRNLFATTSSNIFTIESRDTGTTKKVART